MTWLLPVVAGWAVWLLLDRRLPPQRLFDLLTVPPRPSTRSGRVPGRVRGRRAPSQSRAQPRSHRGHSSSDLAASVDLLAVAVSAGYSLHGAVRVAGAEGHGPVAQALARVAADFDRGVPLADGLAALPSVLGAGAAPLSTTLSVAAVSGTPLGPALQRLADSERRRCRRGAEARARRLPVLLLGPLVGLVLPAFVVLTIVPAALSSVAGRPVPVASTEVTPTRPVVLLPPSTPLSNLPAAPVAPGS